MLHVQISEAYSSPVPEVPNLIHSPDRVPMEALTKLSIHSSVVKSNGTVSYRVGTVY